MQFIFYDCFSWIQCCKTWSKLQNSIVVTNRHDALASRIWVTHICAIKEIVYGLRSRYLRQGWVIAFHSILWDAIIYPCLKYLLLAPKSAWLLFYWHIYSTRNIPIKLHFMHMIIKQVSYYIPDISAVLGWYRSSYWMGFLCETITACTYDIVFQATALVE